MGTVTHTALKIAIFNSGLRQIVIAQRTGIHTSRLSKIASGYEHAKPEERKKLARILKATEAELFPEAVTA